MTRTLIKNARLQGARGDHGVHNFYLKDGLIEGVDLGGEVDETFDVRGQLVTPAFIDLHAHLREPGQEQKEDLASGLAAAAAGGFGTVVSMANTTPPVDDPGMVASLVAKAERLGLARLRPAATLSRGLKGHELTDFAALRDAGAVMITDDGIPVQDGHLMRRACEYAAELGLVIQTHSEDAGLRQNGVMNEGVVSQRLGLPGNPVAAEAAMIYRDCEIAVMTGARVHIAHVSSKRGMQVVEFFKAQGAPVTCEVTPHHLSLTDAVLENFDPIAKVAPPLRTAEDVAYLRDAVKRGVVDSIGTDHAPHTRAEKDRDMESGTFRYREHRGDVSAPLHGTCETKRVAVRNALLRLLQSGPANVMGWTPPTLEARPDPLIWSYSSLETERPVEPLKRLRAKPSSAPGRVKP